MIFIAKDNRMYDKEYNKAYKTMTKLGVDYTQDLPPGMVSEAERNAGAAFRVDTEYRNPTKEANIQGMDDFTPMQRYGGKAPESVRDTLLNGIAKFGGK